jgi:signal transduction histidine kinase
MTESDSPFMERHRVLIVEDDRDFAESLAELLEPLGFVVSSAHSAGEALARLADFSADLALIDVKLGTDNGVELVPLLHTKRPNLVCILMTAYADLDAAMSAVRSGAKDYLLKPLSPKTLPGRLTRVMAENEQRERKEREQRLLMMGNVCASIAHDVNNCLQLMYSHIDDVANALDAVPPDIAGGSSGIHSLSEAVKSAGEVCWRVLEFAKGVPGNSTADIAQVLRNCRPLLARMSRTHVDIEFDIPNGSLWVGLGATQLEQVVTNLVINASHAVGECGKVRVELTEQRGAEGGFARLRVIDNGTGIPKDVLPRIFDPYFSTKASSESTGLGLAIVYGMVTGVAGGEITVETEQGYGSRFTINLPVKDRTGAAAQ